MPVLTPEMGGAVKEGMTVTDTSTVRKLGGKLGGKIGR
jgi:hypothetical protein